MRTTVLRGIALAGAAVLVLSACGSGGDDQPEASPSAPPCKSDGVLKLGNVLPKTGSLAFLGPPVFAGSKLAVEQINAAGGVLGKPVGSADGDSGDTSTNIAVTTTDEMLQSGVDVVVGAVSSPVTKTIIDKITSAGVLQVSPANTSTQFIDWPDQGLYFRTAPSDQFQGAVLAQVAAADGVTKPVVLARQDAYGESLSATFATSFQSAGGVLASETISYDPDAESFETVVSSAKAAAPDAVVLIGYGESAKIVQEMTKQGVGPDKLRLFLVDGNLSNALYQDLPPGIMNGAKGTLPGAQASDEFRAQLLAVNPDLADFSWAAETYDAVNLVALAAVAAQSDCGPNLAKQMQAVSRGGEKCTSFDACAAMLAEGKDIDYDGVSGPVEFADNGDVTAAFMGVYVFGADNKYVPSQFVGPAEVPALPQGQ